MNKLNIILNGNIVEGYQNETVLQLAKRNGIEIPTLCNDDRLEPFSSCYVCVVEIEGMRGLQPSCSTKIAEGMKINTDNEKVYKSRKMAIELMLSNHYADCVAPCKLTCPAGVDVQGYIALIDKGLYNEAVALIKKTNPLPAICGRVCVRPCEVACRRNHIEGVGVGIDYLKRYTSDIDLNSDTKFKPEIKPDTGKKIAVIGAGPAGLTAAYYLRVEGHSVDIFEASPNPGGMLRYGIPPYRLPNDIIDAEVKNITDLGVNIFYNKNLGDNLSYKELKTKYDSFIVTIGSQIGSGIGCENDDAGNIFSGIDFLRNMEMTGQKLDFRGKKIAVIGGGNTAMDCCRTARRCGADDVYVIYRRTEKEMPANPIEIHESKLEGVNYMFLTAPASVVKDADGNLDKLVCYKMELGEPDASGRRRPVKVDGSESEIKLDYILAAIGQKTNVNFLNDINSNTEEPFKLNKWGDIDADKHTLQTSIKNIFAAGDSVTGPATLIEAIAQGRKAARSAHQYLSNQAFTPEPFEFISKKDNFETQKPEDYKNAFEQIEREEMPTLNPEVRNNFDEVELGYENKQAACETQRCLECGCVAYFDCTLKKIASDYKAEQKQYSGDYKKHEVDFAHPFIEIDNNKCILCARCVRICSEVVGANALGLVNRGFDTYVAPSLGDKLSDTQCESCGMCISTCPTAAISENFPFKPGPVKTDNITTVCNYCAVGCELNLKYVNNFCLGVEGSNGLINTDGNLCKYGKFAYSYLNNKERIKKPLLKENGKFTEISFEKAFEILNNRIKNNTTQNAFFAGARLTNEEILLISKLSNTDKTNNVLSSFYYLGKNEHAFAKADVKPTALSEIASTKKIFLLASEINMENGVAGFMINNARKYNKAELITIADDKPNKMLKKSDVVVKVKSYYHLIKALNYYYIKNNLQNNIFISDHSTGFDSYKAELLSQNYDDLVKLSGLAAQDLEKLAISINNEANAIIMFAEKNVSANCAAEIFNLGLITGKIGKTASGIIPLKEKNNAQGLSDLFTSLSLPNANEVLKQLENNNFKNIFIFGEDPVGCAIDKVRIQNLLTKNAPYIVVQDYFLTETALQADLILPSSFAFELGGTFTNTHKYIQRTEKQHNALEINSYQQLSALLNGDANIKDIDSDDILNAYMAVLNKPKTTYEFTLTNSDDYTQLFEYGCDYLNKCADISFNSIK